MSDRFYEQAGMRWHDWTGPRGGKRSESLGWAIPVSVPDGRLLSGCSALSPPESGVCPRCGGTEFSRFPQTFVSCVLCDDVCMRTWMAGIILGRTRSLRSFEVQLPGEIIAGIAGACAPRKTGTS